MTGQFARVPHWLVATGVSDGALRCYIELSMRRDHQTDTVTIAHATIAHATGRSEASVKRQMRELADVGAVTSKANRSGSRQAANTYRLPHSQGVTSERLTRERLTDDPSQGVTSDPHFRENPSRDLVTSSATTNAVAGDAAVDNSEEVAVAHPTDRAMQALCLVAAVTVDAREADGLSVKNAPGLVKHLARTELWPQHHVEATRLATEHPDWTYEQIADAVVPDWRGPSVTPADAPGPEAVAERIVADHLAMHERLHGLAAADRIDLIETRARRAVSDARRRHRIDLDDSQILARIRAEVAESRHLRVVRIDEAATG